MVVGRLRWFWMVLLGFIWFWMLEDGFAWFCVVLDAFGWFSIVLDGFTGFGPSRARLERRVGKNSGFARDILQKCESPASKVSISLETSFKSQAHPRQK